MKKLFTLFGLALAFFASPTTAQAAEELVVDGSKAYFQTLVQGADYILPGTDASWYAQPEFFTRNADGTWRFNAYQYAEYNYTITLNETLKFIEVDEIVGEPSEDNKKSATWSAGLTAALWVNGSYGIGFPAYGNGNGGLGWAEHDGWSGANSIPVPQVDYLKYRMTLVIGKQLDSSAINFKFYMGNRWGGEVTSDFATVEENPYLYMNTGASDTGNFFPQTDARFNDGDTLVINIDMTNGEGQGVITVDLHEYVPADFPTFNGENMTLNGSYFVYTGALEQGQEFTIANEATCDMDIATAYVDPYVATALGNGKFKLNAVSGTYTVALMPKLNYVKIFPGTMDAPATWDADKALWIIGSGVGQPSQETNNSNWGASLANSIPVAQVSQGVYKTELTVGQEITASVNLKLFGQYGWGKEFRSQDLVMTENDYLYLNQAERTVTLNYDDNGNEEYSVDWGTDNGNIFSRDGLAKGDKLILTIDMTDYVPATYNEQQEEVDPGHQGTISVEYVASGVARPTLNGVELTPTESGYVYNGELKQGETYTIAGDNEDVATIKADDFFYNYDYFTRVGDGQYKFNAVSGRYSLNIDIAKKYFRIYPVQEDGTPGIFTEQGGWATWVCGDANIGFPSFAVNRNYWGGDYGWAQQLGISISPAPVQQKLYRLTLTVGKQIGAGAEFKFYDAYNYNYTDGPNTDGLNSTDLIDLDTDMVTFNGSNMQLSSEVTDGDTYVFIIDRTGEKAQLRVEKAQDETGAGVDVATGIQNINVARQNSPAAIFNLQGVRVAKPNKGLYIQNGRKYVVK